MSLRKSLLIVGVGSIGERHVRCFQATGCVDLSICETNPTLRQEIAERYGITAAFENLDSALEKAPDAAVICTPAHLHVALAAAAAQKGVHLLIEKPLSTTLEGVALLESEIETKKLVAAVAYVYRAHPALAAMREAIVARRFGEPVQIVGVFGQHFPFYRPAYRDTYYNRHSTGGGAVQDALTHVINAGEWLVGRVDRLVADAAHQVLPGVEVEDTVHVMTRQGTILGAYVLNQHQAPNEGSLTVVCREGTARFEYHTSRWRWQTEPGGTWHDEPAAKLERDTLFTLQAKSFLNAMDGICAPLCSLAEGVQTLRVNLGILRSLQDRQWQTL